jgi:hypothetical protein
MLSSSEALQSLKAFWPLYSREVLRWYLNQNYASEIFNKSPILLFNKSMFSRYGVIIIRTEGQTNIVKLIAEFLLHLFAIENRTGLRFIWTGKQTQTVSDLHGRGHDLISNTGDIWILIKDNKDCWARRWHKAERLPLHSKGIGL